MVLGIYITDEGLRLVPRWDSALHHSQYGEW